LPEYRERKGNRMDRQTGQEKIREKRGKEMQRKNRRTGHWNYGKVQGRRKGKKRRWEVKVKLSL
jgi:hypothetical protein